MSKKIKKTDPRNFQASPRIKPTSTSTSLQGISFSYKYFQSRHDKFSTAGKTGDYLMALLERLRDISNWKAQELISNPSSTLRCHPIDWNDNTEACFGFPGEEQLVDTPYQFSLSANKHGRVHGFFIEETFYIVWLDPNHKLYQ